MLSGQMPLHVELRRVDGTLVQEFRRDWKYEECHHTLHRGGNPLAGDVTLSVPRRRDIVKSWQMPGVKALAVHQLVPELIDEMKQVEARTLH